MMNISSYSPRNPVGNYFDRQTLTATGLTIDMLKDGIAYTYHILDLIDVTLVDSGAFRLSQMMELANLSTFVGNLLGSGIANSSQNIYKRNGPHKYPDLVANTPIANDVEVKVALERNKPKGHLAKPGYYIVCRYVLGNWDGNFARDERGDVVWIWELRCGLLNETDFNISNTTGDSGKTAVVNKDGMTKLEVVYLDIEKLPFSTKSRVFKEYQSLLPISS